MFRRDLFYRLHVFPIIVPPLRERSGDISLLVAYLIDRYAQKMGKKIRNIDKRTMDLFLAYEWPGNVRELQNVVERAVILCEGETFSVDEAWFTRVAPNSNSVSVQLTELIEREKEMIERALLDSKGVIGGPQGAASRLGIPRQTLESKIKKLGINRNRYKPF
jgi:formate hydrogenlyase transcriptional activator